MGTEKSANDRTSVTVWCSWQGAGVQQLLLETALQMNQASPLFVSECMYLEATGAYKHINLRTQIVCNAPTLIPLAPSNAPPAWLFQVCSGKPLAGKKKERIKIINQVRLSNLPWGIYS